MRSEIEPEDISEKTNEGPVLKPERKNTRKRSIFIFIVVSILNVGLLALLWTQLLTPARQGAQSATPTDQLIGQTAPNFTLVALKSQGTSQKISLADFKGQPVVINFWSSTCEPCKDEAPLLETQWKNSQARGVIFLGIDVMDRQSDGLQFLQQHGATYPNVIDNSGETLVSYAVTYTPETIFIDRSGKVVAAVRMQITSQQLQSNLQKIL